MQRTVFSFILAVSAVSLIGCRSDQGSKTSSQMDEGANVVDPRSTDTTAPAPTLKSEPVTAAKLHDDRPLIVCFGDSLTAGYGADEGASYPDFLQKDLDHSGFRYRVVNEGISGNTTKDGVDRLPGIVALKPEVVVVEFGGNDGLRGLRVQTTRANLSEIVSTVKASGAKVVLAGITLPPDYGADYVSNFTASYPTLGKKYNVPVLPFILRGVYGVSGMMQADNIHATDKGNEIVAKNVFPLVTPFLKK